MTHIKNLINEQPYNQELLKNSTEESSAPQQEFDRYEYARYVFWRAARKRAKFEGREDFVVDAQNKDQVKGFVAWISGDLQTLSELGLSPQKGLMLRGNVGSGKSILFRIWDDLIKGDDSRFFSKMVFTSCEKVAKQYAKGGDAFIERYGELAVRYDVSSTHPDKHSRYVVSFDDLGNEEAKNHYGNFKEVMVDVINHRYDWMVEMGLHTHLTTNLTWQEIADRYGARVESRLRQMCNVLDIGVNEQYVDRRRV